MSGKNGSTAFVKKLAEGQWHLGNESFGMHVSRDAKGMPVATNWVNRTQPEHDWANGAPLGPVLIVSGVTFTPGASAMPCTDIVIAPEVPCLCLTCNSPNDTFHAVFKGLEPKASYYLTSHSQGELGVLSGAQLMREGLACRLEVRRRAQVYILTRQEE